MKGMDPNEKAEDRKDKISKEISELKQITSEQTVKDFSNQIFKKN